MPAVPHGPITSIAVPKGKVSASHATQMPAVTAIRTGATMSDRTATARAQAPLIVAGVRRAPMPAARRGLITSIAALKQTATASRTPASTAGMAIPTGAIMIVRVATAQVRVAGIVRRGRRANTPAGPDVPITSAAVPRVKASAMLRFWRPAARRALSVPRDAGPGMPRRVPVAAPETAK